MFIEQNIKSTPNQADFAFELIQIYFPEHQALSHYQTLKANASSKEQLDLGESYKFFILTNIELFHIVLAFEVAFSGQKGPNGKLKTFTSVTSQHIDAKPDLTPPPIKTEPTDD